MSDAQQVGTKSPFLPLLLLACGFSGWIAFQMTQLLAEREALAALKLSQTEPLEQSRKLREALDSVAASTQRLADAGNASAKVLVEELRKRGITIDPNAHTVPPPP